MTDITIIYYTCNEISDYFAANTWSQLLKAAKDLPIITVSHKPLLGTNNIVVDLPRHHLSIYKQALIGAKAATSEYIALAEDDVLYSAEHFKYRSSVGKFAYNMNSWNVAMWNEPLFTQKSGGRRNLSQLICERQLFIEAMEERFNKHNDRVNISLWAEPSKYERHLGVKVREWEAFNTNPPNIVFSHETALSYANLGSRKRPGEIRASQIPSWGNALDIVGLYK